MTARSSAVLLLIAGVGLSLWGVRQNADNLRAGQISEKGIPWEPYSEVRLQELLQAGRPVFIDFTAAWCLTCQVNERVALGPSKVIDAFRDSGLTAIKADWTSQDPAITQALARYGRNSIPLYVLYSSGSTEPVLLPEILTPSIVLKALEDIENKK